jgi:hypothetical protein
MKTMMVLATALAATSLAGAPVGARVRHAPPCKRIQEALAAGRTPEQVAQDLKVSAATVKRCTPSTAKGQSAGSTAKAMK